MQPDATGAFIYGTIWLGLAGGLGWVGAHGAGKAQKRHVTGNAKAERKTNFLSFMDGWRIEIESESSCAIPTEFEDKWSDFRTQAAKIRLDYGAEFWRLSTTLSGLCSDEKDEGANQESRPKHEKLLTGLDAVIDS